MRLVKYPTSAVSGRSLQEWLKQGGKLELDARSSSDKTLTINFIISNNYGRDGWYAGVCGVSRSTVGDQPKIDMSTGSDRSIAFARESIRHCVGSHKQCRTAGTTKSPTRLIELHENGIRLSTSTNARISHEYLTLSHCWGSIEILKLKKGNILVFQNEIPADRLCKTFQDAINVTRALGFSYLWIDSLCIIQDDDEDWQRESSAMADVYCNATASIAATGAKDGSVGLFFEKSTLLVLEKHTPADKKVVELEDWYSYERCLAKSPLSSRAWAFQERYLAKRTIHFSAEKIYFECRSHITSDVFSSGVPEDHIDIEFPRRDDVDEWSKIVQLYSRGQLTFSKDKLVALSGIARRLQSNQNKYCAGLWRNNLEWQLCWRVCEPLSHRSPAEGVEFPYRAPTWSWASIDQPVTWKLYTTNYPGYNHYREKVVIDILDIPLQPLTLDPYGQLQGAELKLKCGPLIDSTTILSLDAKFKYGAEFKLNDFQIRGYTFFDLGEKWENTQAPFYLLPILEDPKGDSKSYHHGLFITKANGQGKGRFIRIGVWNYVFNVKNYDDLMARLLRQPGSLILDEDLYESKAQPSENGIPQFVITLV